MMINGEISFSNNLLNLLHEVKKAISYYSDTAGRSDGRSFDRLLCVGSLLIQCYSWLKMYGISRFIFMDADIKCGVFVSKHFSIKNDKLQHFSTEINRVDIMIKIEIQINKFCYKIFGMEIVMKKTYYEL